MSNPRKINHTSMVLAGCFLLLGVYLVLSSFSLPGGAAGYPGARFFPQVLGIVIVVLSGLLVLEGWLGDRAGSFEVGHAGAVAGVAALTLVYLLLWGTGFFPIRTFIFIALLLRFLKQPWKTGLTVAAVLAAVVTVAFGYGLHLSLD